MSILRIRKKENFTTLCNSLINDASLSFRALGVLTYLLSKPANWQVRIAELSKHRKEGRDAIRAVMRELIQAGYAARYKLQSEATGQIHGCIYEIFEEPISSELRDAPESFVDAELARKKPETKTRKLGFPIDGSPVAGEPVAGILPPTKTIVTKERVNKSYPLPFPVERGSSSFVAPGKKDCPLLENGRTDYARLIADRDPLAGIIPELFPSFRWENSHDTAKYYARLRGNGRLPDRDLLTLQKFYRTNVPSEIDGWRAREPKELLRDKLSVALQVIREYLRNFEIAPLDVKLSGDLWEPELMVRQAASFAESHGTEDDYIPPSIITWAMALVRYVQGKPITITPVLREKILQELAEHFDALPHLLKGKADLPAIFGGITEAEVLQAREVWASELNRRKEEFQKYL